MRRRCNTLRRIRSTQQRHNRERLFGMLITRVSGNTRTLTGTIRLFLIKRQAHSGRVNSFLVTMTVLNLNVISRVLSTMTTGHRLTLVKRSLSISLIMTIRVQSADRAHSRTQTINVTRTTLSVILSGRTLFVEINQGTIMRTFTLEQGLTTYFMVRGRSTRIVVRTMVSFLNIMNRTHSSPNHVKITYVNVHISNGPQQLTHCGQCVGLGASSH